MSDKSDNYNVLRRSPINQGKQISSSGLDRPIESDDDKKVEWFRTRQTQPLNEHNDNNDPIVLSVPYPESRIQHLVSDS